MFNNQDAYCFVYKFLTESRLFEMARKKTKAIERVSYYDETLAEHIAKLFCLEDSQTHAYWKKEIIRNYIIKIDSLCNVSYGNGRISKADLMEVLWDDPLGELRQLKSKINNSKFREDYADYPFVPLVKYNLDIVHTKMYQFYDKMCTELSKKDCDVLVVEDMIRAIAPAK